MFYWSPPQISRTEEAISALRLRRTALAADVEKSECRQLTAILCAVAAACDAEAFREAFQTALAAGDPQAMKVIIIIIITRCGCCSLLTIGPPPPLLSLLLPLFIFRVYWMKFRRKFMVVLGTLAPRRCSICLPSESCGLSWRRQSVRRAAPIDPRSCWASGWRRTSSARKPSSTSARREKSRVAHQAAEQHQHQQEWRQLPTARMMRATLDGTAPSCSLSALAWRRTLGSHQSLHPPGPISSPK